MKVTLSGFKGEAPRIAPRDLPAPMAQVAKNTRLLSGNLEAYKDIADVHALGKSGPVETLYRMAGKYWLCWPKDVDVARIPIAGNTDQRVVITGDGTPALATLAQAVGDPSTALAYGAYPLETVPLGLVLPTTAPTVVQGSPPVSDNSIVKNYPCTDYHDWSIQYVHHDGDWDVWWELGTVDGATVWQFHAHEIPSGNYLRGMDAPPSLANADSFTFSVQVRNGTDTPRGGIMFAETWSGISTDSVYSQVQVLGVRNCAFVDFENKTLVLNNNQPTRQSVDLSALGLANNQWYTLTVSGKAAKDANGDAGFNCTATLTGNQGALSETTAALFTPYAGDALAIVGGVPYAGAANGNLNDGNRTMYLWFRDIALTVTPTEDPIIPVYTSYVYTYIDSLGRESGPSPASKTVQTDNSITNDITLPAAPAGSEALALYRSATGASGTIFQLVADIESPSSTVANTYSDSKSTDELGDELGTSDYIPPPDDLQGVIALPNEIIAGFSGNTLCLSARGQSQAYPLANRMATDSQIVCLGAIDTTVLVLTQSTPYTAYGSDPSTYTMTKEEFSQGCVSKRSVAYVRGVGIVYASTDGIYAYQGQGNIRNLTANLFRLREWSTLNPASIFAVVHESLYFFWYDNGTTKGGYILDTANDGFGLVELDFHAIAAWDDPVSGDLYLVIDSGTVGGATPASNELLQYNAATALKPYTWRSKKLQVDHPVAFQFLRVVSESYTGTTVKLYADGQLFATLTPAGMDEFVIPPQIGRVFEAEVSGTDSIASLELCEESEEL